MFQFWSLQESMFKNEASGVFVFSSEVLSSSLLKFQSQYKMFSDMNLGKCLINWVQTSSGVCHWQINNAAGDCPGKKQEYFWHIQARGCARVQCPSLKIFFPAVCSHGLTPEIVLGCLARTVQENVQTIVCCMSESSYREIKYDLSFTASLHELVKIQQIFPAGRMLSETRSSR